MWWRRIIKILAELTPWVSKLLGKRAIGPLWALSLLPSPTPGVYPSVTPHHQHSTWHSGSSVNAGQMYSDDITVCGPDDTHHTLIRSVLEKKPAGKALCLQKVKAAVTCLADEYRLYEALPDQALLSPGIAYHLKLPLLPPSGEYRTRAGIPYFLYQGTLFPLSNLSEQVTERWKKGCFERALVYTGVLYKPHPLPFIKLSFRHLHKCHLLP